jgi:hypothetical protein
VLLEVVVELDPTVESAYATRLERLSWGSLFMYWTLLGHVAAHLSCSTCNVTCEHNSVQFDAFRCEMTSFSLSRCAMRYVMREEGKITAPPSRRVLSVYFCH